MIDVALKKMSLAQKTAGPIAGQKGKSQKKMKINQQRKARNNSSGEVGLGLVQFWGSFILVLLSMGY
jgi:hypothetical protein